MQSKIPDGLEFISDPYLNYIFPSLPKSVRKAHMTEPPKVRQNIVEEDQESLKKCTWGTQRIQRFINRYICIFRKKHFNGREMFLSQLEDVARENGVKLPTRDEMREKSDVPKKRLTCQLVDENSRKVGTYKYYWAGSNYVAYIPGENKYNGERELHKRTRWDDLFDFHYAEYRKKYKRAELRDPIVRDMLEVQLEKLFYEGYDYDDKKETETCPEFIQRKMYNSSAAYSGRKRRFYRKKDQIQWTAWWTITYSDDKFKNEQQFRKRLLNKFRNLAVRKYWRIMGVFEHGEENGRLHFHGFFYIPEGQQVGEIEDRKNYSEKNHQWHFFKANTEFERDFGINEYEDISEAMSADSKAMADYTYKMLRYMEKGEKVFYSRHIPTEFEGRFRENDMLMFFNITCKRKMKRYIVRPDIMCRTETKIIRKQSVEEQEVIDIGLVDENAI